MYVAVCFLTIYIWPTIGMNTALSFFYIQLVYIKTPAMRTQVKLNSHEFSQMFLYEIPKVHIKVRPDLFIT